MVERAAAHPANVITGLGRVVSDGKVIGQIAPPGDAA